MKNNFPIDWEIPEFDYKQIREKSSDYCVCIPVINEGERIQAQLHKLNSIAKNVDVLICDGGSTDGSLGLEILSKQNVRGLLTKLGPGKLSAQLRMGYAFALDQGYKGIVTVDGNGKDSVENIPDFIKELENGWDFIQGSRYVKGGKAINTPKIREIAVKLIHIPIISILAGFKYTDTTNGFRGYSSRMLLDERIKPFRNIFDTYELLAYLSVVAPKFGFKTKEIPVTRAYPENGKVPTKISPFKGNFGLIKILFNLAMGKYYPK